MDLDRDMLAKIDRSVLSDGVVAVVDEMIPHFECHRRITVCSHRTESAIRAGPQGECNSDWVVSPHFRFFRYKQRMSFGKRGPEVVSVSHHRQGVAAWIRGVPWRLSGSPDVWRSK